VSEVSWPRGHEEQLQSIAEEQDVTNEEMFRALGTADWRWMKRQRRKGRLTWSKKTMSWHLAPRDR
jgi:hypothetical protein